MVDDGRAATAAEAADVVERKGAAADFGEWQAAFFGSLYEPFDVAGDFHKRHVVGVAQDGDEQAFRCGGGNADMVGTFVNNLAALFIQAGVEDREFFEQGNQKFDEQRDVGEPDTPFFCERFDALTQGFEGEAIDLIEGGGVGNGAPGAFHVFGDAFAQAG